MSTARCHHLLLAAGRPACGAITQLMQLRQQGVDPLDTLARLPAPTQVAKRRGDDLGPERAAERAQHEVRLDRQAGKDLASFRHLRSPRRTTWFGVLPVTSSPLT